MISKHNRFEWRTVSRNLFLGIAIFMLGACAQGMRAPQVRTSENAYKPAKPSSWTLPNGLTVFFRQDSELPIVQAALFLKGGGLWEDSAEIGSISAMGDQLRQGGTGILSPDELDRSLEELAASISSAFAAENGKVAFSCLSADVDTVFPIFASVALAPRFDAERLNLFKGQALESLRRRSEDAATVADIAFAQLLFGESALGRVAVASDIQRLSREMLIRNHARFVRPNGAVLAITGDISEARVRVLVEEYFASWRPKVDELPQLELPKTVATPGIYFIELPFSQSTILMGHLGVPRLTPDYPSIDAFNDIFGLGGFGSRLMSRVRTELGLAYGIYGMISPGFPIGRNFISLQTKSESTAQALTEAVGVLTQMQAESVEKTALAESQRSLASAFIFKFDSTEKIVQRQALFELLGYPADYDSTYVDKINALTPIDVQTVAQRRWDLSKFVIVVVGDNSAYTQVEAMVKDSSSPLSGKSLRKLHFDQKLILP
jgi:zinc protease